MRHRLLFDRFPLLFPAADHRRRAAVASGSEQRWRARTYPAPRQHMVVTRERRVLCMGRGLHGLGNDCVVRVELRRRNHVCAGEARTTSRVDWGRSSEPPFARLV